ncbi:unnamed protein product [Mycena citricolor]|uniref:Carbohydrate esterase family 16 protein n=1 Tax=Mycena citricolor TaxID=2018698 RepID=A0AAD2HXP5_9AGAR|nr:unnamed protein product [Mycena citricolor]
MYKVACLSSTTSGPPKMFLFLLSLFFTGISVAASQNAKQFDWNSIRYVHAFGDSYTFVQGTAGHANFSFIGDALNLAFTPKQLLANEIIAKNTSSEGSNWIEYLTGCFQGSPLDCDKQLWNFAFAGSDISGDLLPLHHPFTTSLVNQVKQWATYGSSVIPHPANETLTAWWIGINDTGDSLTNASITDFNAFWETEMKAYFTAVQSAHDHGLKTHLFINVPAEDRNPATVNSATKSALMKTHIQQYNTIWINTSLRLLPRIPVDATVMTFDSNTLFNNILNNPAQYGFKNVTGFCTCADPTGFFWFSQLRPSDAAGSSTHRCRDRRSAEEPSIPLGQITSNKKRRKTTDKT